VINYVRGNLFSTDCDIIAHGCNCRGGFGKGIAAHMAKLYPKAREAYLRKYKTEGWQLGDVQFVQNNGKIIANCATQDRYWKTGAKTVLVECWAVRSCMAKIASYASAKKLSVALPRIGAGLAGGNWDKIKQILERELQNIDTVIYEL